MNITPGVLHRRVPWKNGLGSTLELHVEGAADNWDWRLSVASVDASGPFSQFVDVDRSLTVIFGAGVMVDVAGQPQRCGMFESVEFPGDVVTRAELLDGPIRDLNVMTRRDRAVASVRIIRGPSDLVPVGGDFEFSSGAVPQYARLGRQVDYVISLESLTTVTIGDSTLELGYLDLVNGFDDHALVAERGMIAVVTIGVLSTFGR
jgi:HutD